MKRKYIKPTLFTFSQAEDSPTFSILNATCVSGPSPLWACNTGLGPGECQSGGSPDFTGCGMGNSALGSAGCKNGNDPSASGICSVGVGL